MSHKWRIFKFSMLVVLMVMLALFGWGINCYYEMPLTCDEIEGVLMEEPRTAVEFYRGLGRVDRFERRSIGDDVEDYVLRMAFPASEFFGEDSNWTSLLEPRYVMWYHDEGRSLTHPPVNEIAYVLIEYGVESAGEAWFVDGLGRSYWLFLAKDMRILGWGKR